MTLSGAGVTPGALGANPTSLEFGTVQVGNNQVLSETVTNTRWFERDDFSGRGERRGFRVKWALDPSDAGSGTERELQCDLHSHSGGQRQWKRDRYF